MLKRVLLPLSCSLLLVACASVKETPGAAAVQLLTQTQAASCQRLGSASAQVLDEVLFVDRDQAAMAEELLKLAKNEAVKMQGNAVVIASDIVNGSRDFTVYRC